MKKYLTQWNDGEIHSAIFAAPGILRLMRNAYAEKKNMQVCVFKLAEDNVYTPPVPLRVWYDWVRDHLSLFTLSGEYIELCEGGKFDTNEKKGVA